MDPPQSLNVVGENNGKESSADTMPMKKRVSAQPPKDRGGSVKDEGLRAPCTSSGMRSTGLVVTERWSYTQEHLDAAFPSSLPETTSLFQLLRQQCRWSRSCVAGGVLSLVPVVGVLKRYSWAVNLGPDVVSGISVGFLHLPQGLGFGLLADLSPVHGLYTSLFPVLVYLLFGTSPHVSMGTNAVVALLSASIVDMEATRYLDLAGQTHNHTAVSPAQLLRYKVGVSTAAAMLEGIILIAMGVLRMGFLTNYMSNSFIGGFSFAAAVHITVSQVVKLFHLQLHPGSGLGKLVFTTADVVRNIADTNPADVLVGLVCGALLLGIKTCINERYRHRLKVPVPAELIVVILSTAVSHFADLKGRFNVDVVGDIPQGLPAPSVPPVEVMRRIVPYAFVDAVLIFVLTITLAKLTAKLHVINIDDNQELVAYGLCQVVGSFFQNFSSSISPPRTMMLSSMGSRSTLNGVSTSVFLLLVLLVAGKLFVSLPIAMLAVMIIVAMKDLLLQVGKVRKLWYVNKGDFLIWVLTVVFSVFGDLSVGLVAGTLSSMVMVLAYSQLARGTLLGKAADQDLYLTTDRQGIHNIPGVRIFRFESQLHFASAERFKSEIYRKVFDPTSITYKDHLEIDVAESSRSESPGSRQVPSRGQETFKKIKKQCLKAASKSLSLPLLKYLPKGEEAVHAETQESGHAELQESGHAELQESGHAETQESGHAELQKSGHAELQESGHAELQESGHAELQESGHAELQESGHAETQESGHAGTQPKLVDAQDMRNNAVTVRSPKVSTGEEEEEDPVRFVILDCSTMTYVDLTGVEMLHLIITQFSRAGVEILLTDIPSTTLAILHRVDFFMHEDARHVYHSVLDALHGIRSRSTQKGIRKSFA